MCCERMQDIYLKLRHVMLTAMASMHACRSTSGHHQVVVPENCLMNASYCACQQSHSGLGTLRAAEESWCA